VTVEDKLRRLLDRQRWLSTDPEKLVVEGAVKHVVRVTSDGVDRAKLVAWAEAKLS
jgi:hypothetical protein